jgi:hypothetical protein
MNEFWIITRNGQRWDHRNMDWVPMDKGSGYPTKSDAMKMAGTVANLVGAEESAVVLEARI